MQAIKVSIFSEFDERSISPDAAVTGRYVFPTTRITQITSTAEIGIFNEALNRSMGS
jgi:hypothetical protein